MVILAVGATRSLFKSYRDKRAKKKEKGLWLDPAEVAREQRAAARRERAVRRQQRLLDAAARRGETRFSADTLRGMMAGDLVLGRRRFSDESTVVEVLAALERE